MKDITPEDSIAPVFLAPPSKDELVELENLKKEQATREAEFVAQETAKEKLQATAIAKLAKLGLTEDEARAIVGA